MTRRIAVALAVVFAVDLAAARALTASPEAPQVPRKLVEIYHIAPGQHEAFLRAIARLDEANRRAGLAPRELYVHSDGASWDFMLIQDAEVPEAASKALGEAYRDLGLPTGARFFTEFRTFILEHTDTFVRGPTTAAQFLTELAATSGPSRLIATSQPRYDLVQTVDLGGTPRWDYLVADPAARRLYVAHDTVVDVVDLDTKHLVGHVTSLAGAHGIALAPEIGRGFVANSDRDTVSAFNLATLVVTGEAKTGAGPDSVTFEPSTRRLFVWNGDGHDVTVIDAASLKRVATLPLGGAPEFAVADGRGNVFVNLEDTSELVRVDASRAEVAARHQLAGCESPTGLAFDARTNRLFTDAATGQLLGTGRIGRGADAVVFDASQSRVFVSNGEGFVSIFDQGSPPALLGPPVEVQTRVTGRTVAVDQRSGDFFVPAVDLDIDWGARKATFAPGGLRLYVFAPTTD
jgi:YVTN family beta-propeller protein